MRGQRPLFRMPPLAFAVAMAYWPVSSPLADDGFLFNDNFLKGTGAKLDLSLFEKGNALLPGTHRLDVFVNQALVGRLDVRVDAATGGGEQPVCLRHDGLEVLGLDMGRLRGQERAMRVLEQDCVDPRQLDPQISLSLDPAAMSASLSIPQVLLGHRARGTVDPRDWTSGESAGFVSYNANAYRTEQDYSGSRSDRFYTNLDAGLNLEGWRLRHNGSYSRSDGRGQYQASSSFLQHDVTALTAQATVGEYYSPGDIFDSVPYSGVQLTSDDRMLPESQRGFAPVVRGVADSNASVSIRQAGNLVYQTTVAPGPFEIDDLYNTGYAGDLEVTVTEADGQAKRFVVPYASVNQLLRPGASRFSVVAGNYRDDQLSDGPGFVQGTYRRGLSDDLTLYTGSIMAEKYLALLGGAAVNTAYGALGADVTYSRASDLPGWRQGTESNMSGKSYRVTYSKRLDATRTNFAIAAYRFSSRGFLSLSNYALLNGSDSASVYRERNRFQLNIDQPLGQLASLYISGLRQNYWDREGANTTYQAGINKSFGWGSLGFSASRTLNDDGYDTQYVLSLSLPLDFGARVSGAYLRNSVIYGDADNNSLQTTLSGVGGARNQGSYSLYRNSTVNGGRRNQSYGGNLQYNASQVAVGMSLSRGEDYTQYSLGAHGTVVGDAQGVVFGAGQGETMAIVEAKGGAGAHLLSGSNASLDGDGQALVTGLSPYRNNEVRIDPKGASQDVDFKVTSQMLAPRDGAIVRLRFDTETGAPLLLQISGDSPDGIPFGAQVLDAAGQAVSMVGQSGMALLRSDGEATSYVVKWGETAAQQCRLQIVPPAQGRDLQQRESLQLIPARCTSSPGGESVSLNRATPDAGRGS